MGDGDDGVDIEAAMAGPDCGTATPLTTAVDGRRPESFGLVLGDGYDGVAVLPGRSGLPARTTSGAPPEPGAAEDVPG